MQAFSNKLLSDLDRQLSSIEEQNETMMRRSELSFAVCKTEIDQLKNFALKYKFKSDAEEIKFFKEIKPQFTSKLVYHLMLYNIETKKPNGGKEILKKYFTKELEKLKHYFDYNLDFYRYYRARASYLDDKYFMRDKYDIQLTLEGHIFENDTRFSSLHDFKVAKIMAHDRLQVFLEEELATLERKEPVLSTQETARGTLTWHDTKTSLIELIYALQSHGAFGNQADIKEIAAYFENAFNIDLGDYYRTYLEIRIRKTGRTKFLSLLQETLTKRMDQADEK